MTKNLVIVESPTKAKTIEKFLGRTYTVRASMGHLRDLLKSRMSVDVEHDFEPQYTNIRGKGELIKELKKLAKEADHVYLATDPDREGEAISWHLAYILGIDPEASACRVVFHEITEKTVKEAIKHPRKIDMDMVNAQQTRRILDRIVGYTLSPLLWRKVCKGLSAGRVQSVAVKIIADRDREIEDFEPEEYWTISAKLREDAKSPIFVAKATKFKGKELKLHNADEAHAAELELQKARYVINKAEKKERKSHPAPPFTTSNLQQEANKKLNFSAQKTMMVAQQLYEGVSLGKASVGLITYMRTDAVRLADEAINEIRAYLQNNMGDEYCPSKPNHYKTGKNAQDAHEAIRPTSVMRTPEAVAAHLTADQLKLYTLIWKRTVASQMKDAVYDTTALTIGAGDYQLNANGSVLRFPGFLALYKLDSVDDKDKSVPYIEPGKELKLHKLEPAEQHFTEPPAHFTEASLIKYLEEKGIGRPSTYAPTISTIIKRGYVVKDAKKLLVTEIGFQTTDMLTEYFSDLLNENFSAGMETSLDEIAEAKDYWVDVIRAFYDPFMQDVKLFGDKCPPVPPAPPRVSDVKCEKCGRLMVIKEGRFGEFLACPGFPECRNAKPLVKKIGVACPRCGGELLERRGKTGKIFYGCENYPQCEFTSWDLPLKEQCPKCGSMLVEHSERNGKKKIYCSNPECEDARPVRSATATSSTRRTSKTTTARKTAGARKTTTRKRATAKK